MILHNSTIAIVACIANAVSAGVFQLPITRHTIGWNIVFARTEGHTKNDQVPFVFQDPHRGRVLHAREEEQGKIDRESSEALNLSLPAVAPRTTGHHSDDEIVYWSMYTVPISIGNPPLNLTALVDTGWSTFFVPSANCSLNPRKEERELCLEHAPLYNSSKSSTYCADLTPTKMVYTSYNGVETWGKQSRDNIHVAGMEIQGQVFEESLIWHPSFLTRDDHFDTALGLSLHRTPEPWGNFSAASPFQNMVEQRLLDRDLFTLRLARTDNETGELMLGGVPEALNRSEMVQVQLAHHRNGGAGPGWDFYSSSGWQISAQQISMDFEHRSVPVMISEHTAIVSSSYPYIGLSEDAAAAANQAIGLEELYDWVDCETRPDLPNMTFTLGPDSLRITLTPWDYLIEVYDDLFLKLKCVSAFQSLEEYGEMGFVILGAAFLNGLWSIWDKDESSISFANRAL